MSRNPEKSVTAKSVNATKNQPTPPEGALRTAATSALEDKKAKDVTHICLHGKSSMADDMLIATGTSRTHVLALAEAAQQALKEAGAPIVSTEGEEEGQWVLVDGGDVIVHIFQPETRDHYRLERLWSSDFDVDEHESDGATEADLVTNAS